MLSFLNSLGTLLSDEGIATKTGGTCFHFDGAELHLASLQLTMMCTQKNRKITSKLIHITYFQLFNN